MLFNRQENLDVTIPEEVIIYFFITGYSGMASDFSGNSSNGIVTPSMKNFRELIETLATIGVQKFNIVCSDLRSTEALAVAENDYLVNVVHFANIIKSTFRSISKRRTVEYSFANGNLEPELEPVRNSDLPKFFMASNYLTFFKKELLNKFINYALVTPINSNSYFIGTGNEPFVLKGQDDRIFADYLGVIKNFFDTPLATLDLEAIHSYRYHNSIRVPYYELLNATSYLHNSFEILINVEENLYKHFLTYRLKHELVISTAINMLSKPGMFQEGQLVIPKQILDAVFNTTVEKLGMNPKASPVVTEQLSDRLFNVMNSTNSNL